MVQNKFAGCCLGPRLSNGTTCMVGIDTNHFLSSQTQAEAHFSCFFMKFHQNPQFWFKNPISSNVKKEVVERKKNFWWVPWATICSQEVVWVLGYLTKQTGWSYDTSINFYDSKRKERAIFSFSYPLRVVFNRNPSKMSDFHPFSINFKNNVSHSMAILGRLTHCKGMR